MINNKFKNNSEEILIIITTVNERNCVVYGVSQITISIY